MQSNAVSPGTITTASAELETPLSGQVGNKTGSDSCASDAGVRFHLGAEEGKYKSQQTRQQPYLV